MYFYRISARDYEESFETTFYSSVKYSQEEFENIVIDAYQKSCKDYIEKDDSNVCLAYNFGVDDIIWDHDKNFEKIMEDEYELHSLSKILNGEVSLDLTRYGQKNHMDRRIKKALLEIYIDESCWDDNCFRLKGNHDIPWHKRNCLVFERKQSRIKDRNCDNCFIKIYGCPQDKGDSCVKWRWDGDDTL